MISKVREWLDHKRFRRGIRQWFRQRGDENLRLDYPLDASSIVFDVGGFEGDFAAAIHKRYGCTVHVFEPVPDFLNSLRSRFEGNPQIIIHPFGLGGRTETVPMSLAANGSSHVKEAGGDRPVSAQIQSYAEFIAQSGVTTVDLMKSNIEGAEFDLLEHMLDNGGISNIRDLQVQFHQFVPDASRRRRAIRRRLTATHALTYEYYFVWENWRLKQAR